MHAHGIHAYERYLMVQILKKEKKIVFGKTSLYSTVVEERGAVV